MLKNNEKSSIELDQKIEGRLTRNINSEENRNPKYVSLSGQKLSKEGKILVPKKAWPLRIITIIFLSSLIGYSFFIGIELQNPLIFFSILLPFEALMVLTIGWFFYKNPAQGQEGNELVSVIIPIYNQKDMIPIVIDAIANSTYKKLEIIAINDGSTDGTKEILDNLGKKYPQLAVIHKKNGGKRKANLAGFEKSKGKFIVFIDSDSVIDHQAISEFLKTFNGDPKAGALVGHANVWNSKKNMLTKIQDSWYDFSFNIVKTTESTLNNVLVCSGCLAAYRRDSIKNFVWLWGKDDSQNQKTEKPQYFKSNPWGLTKTKRISERILEWSSQFDDSEDSVLTSQTLVDWRTKYVSSAKVYTDVPEKTEGFVKQQIRWKKGWLRASLFLMTFIWRKNPIISSVFYINFASGLLMPLIMFTIFFYVPVIMNQWHLPLLFIAGMLLVGFVQGLDFKLRDSGTKNWKFKPLTNMFTGFLLPWLLFPALWSIKKSQWMTR